MKGRSEGEAGDVKVEGKGEELARQVAGRRKGRGGEEATKGPKRRTVVIDETTLLNAESTYRGNRDIHLSNSRALSTNLSTFVRSFLVTRGAVEGAGKSKVEAGHHGTGSGKGKEKKGRKENPRNPAKPQKPEKEGKERKPQKPSKTPKPLRKTRPERAARRLLPSPVVFRLPSLASFPRSPAAATLRRMSAFEAAAAAPRVQVKLKDEASRLFRVWKVVQNLLSKRGYGVLQTDQKMESNEFVARFSSDPDRGSLTILVTHNDNQEQLIVYFPSEEKVGVKQIQAYSEQMKENNIKNAILVLRLGITPFAKEALTVSEGARTAGCAAYCLYW